MKLTYTVVLRPEPEGGFTVLVPALPGCLTCGDTVLEALRMAQEAIECYLESLAQHGEPLPREAGAVELDTEHLSEALLYKVSAVIEEVRVA